MKKSFTLIELLVVLAIVAILTAIISAATFKAIERSRVTSTLGDFKSIKVAATAYFSDTGTWPTDGTTTVGFTTSNGVTGWNGPYLDRWPASARWGGIYRFRNNSAIGGGGCTTTCKYVRVTSVPYSAAVRIEATLDAGVANWGAGIVRTPGAIAPAIGSTTIIEMLISSE